MLMVGVISLGLACWGDVAHADDSIARVVEDGRADDAIDYAADVRPILVKYCVGCHNAIEHESGLQLHSLTALQRGGDSGKVIEPGRPEDSLLWKSIQGDELAKMPPEDMPQPSADEIDRLRRWIVEGAKGEDRDVPLASRWIVPKTDKAYGGPAPITAAITMNGQAHMNGQAEWLLLGRHNALEAVRGPTRVRLDVEIIGKVNQLRLSPDGRMLAVATGIPGVGGQTLVIEAATLELDSRPTGSSPSSSSPRSDAIQPHVILRVEGHSDCVNAAAISPDGRTLATAGHDRVIHLWDIANGKKIRTLQGHNGAIYDVDFDGSGQVLVSASADETVKVWRVDSGERLDTLGQGEAEQVLVRFDDAQQRILAAGADRRVRVWKLLSKDKPTVSPMVAAVFAHEAPILQLSLSHDGRWVATAAEDRTVKLWDAQRWQPLGLVGKLDDVATSLQWDRSDSQLVATTLAGSIQALTIPSSVLREGTVRQEGMLERTQSVLVPSTTDLAPAPLSSRVTIIEEEIEPVLIPEASNGSRSPATAQSIPVPSIVRGGVLTDEDAASATPGDWYAFDAKRGEEWIVSIEAAGRSSPMDSWLDITDPQGQPLLRTRLQAVRESYFTFRGKDSTNIDDFRLHRWEDMELNQYLFAAGEVVRLWLYPRGPDSGFKVYPGSGNRHTYFGTSATTHALNEPAWVVEEIGLEGEPLSNGLPVFPITYSNDDDPQRRLGKDSWIHFVAPKDGTYLVRVRDARGQSGDAYQYQLSIVPPQPRFQFRVEQSEITLRPNVGTEFSVMVERMDGLTDAVQFVFEGLPEGVTAVEPLFVESNQQRAIGQLSYVHDAWEKLPKEFEVTLKAQSQHAGRPVESKEVAKLKVKLSDKPAMRLKLVERNAPNDAAPLTELRLHPGETIIAKLVIERGENAGDIALGGDDSGRNLPHGCFVDNIGLSGLLIPAGQSTREVFITASPIVTRQERMFHLRAQVDGNPTTTPVRLIVE
jgi:hypothetical protein